MAANHTLSQQHSSDLLRAREKEWEQLLTSYQGKWVGLVLPPSLPFTLPLVLICFLFCFCGALSRAELPNQDHTVWAKPLVGKHLLPR